MKALLLISLNLLIVLTMGRIPSQAGNQLNQLPPDIKELFMTLQNEGHLDENGLPVTREGFERLKKANLLRDDLNIDASLHLRKATTLLYEENTDETEGKLVQVIKELNKAIEIDPGFGPAYNQLGIAFLDRKSVV